MMLAAGASPASRCLVRRQLVLSILLVDLERGAALSRDLVAEERTVLCNRELWGVGFVHGRCYACAQLARHKRRGAASRLVPRATRCRQQPQMPVPRTQRCTGAFQRWRRQTVVASMPLHMPAKSHRLLLM
eukprot:COSAG02_NODE_4772_length_4994_cov_16.312768_5_plen_131_part_00